MRHIKLLLIVVVLVGCSENANKSTIPESDTTASSIDTDTNQISSNTAVLPDASPKEDTIIVDTQEMEPPADNTNAERIDFEKEGSSHLVWEQKVGANKSKTFVFKAKIGQKLELGFIDDTNIGSMVLGKYSIEPNSDENFTMQIAETKDYTFTVTNNSKKSTSFRIFITLE